MAGTKDTLQEYLVKLGYQVDGTSLRKFEDSLGKVGKTVFKTGAAVAATVASVEAAAAAFAYSMRKIYFQSELANTSAKNIRALGYAGKQIGADLESAVHGMAQAVRLNPGLQGLVESFGVKVTGRDMSDVMLDFVNALKGMPEYQATQYAALFGIDPDTYHQMIGHMDELIQKKQQMIDLYKNSGVDPDSAKQTVLQYTAALDELEARLGVLGESLLIKMQPSFQKVTTFLNSVLEDWTKRIGGVQKQFTLDKETGKQVLGFGKAWLGGAEGLEAWFDGTKPAANDASAGASSPSLYERLLKRYGPRGMRNLNPGNLEYAGQAGAGKEAGPNGRFATFKTMEEGSAALADQLNRYQKSGVDTVRKIISKFAPKGENNTEAYIDFVSKKLGIDSNNPIDFSKNPTLMKNIMEAVVGYENGPSYIKDAKINEGLRASKFGQGLGSADAARLGGSSDSKVINLNFKSDIKVTGSDPESTGKAVENAQARVYGDVIRNTRSALT